MIQINFKKDQTGKDLYKLVLKSLHDTVRVSAHLLSDDELTNLKRDLHEYIAIINNNFFERQYPQLAKEKDLKCDLLNMNHKNVSEQWTIDGSGNRIEFDEAA